MLARPLTRQCPHKASGSYLYPACIGVIYLSAIRKLPGVISIPSRALSAAATFSGSLARLGCNLFELWPIQHRTLYQAPFWTVNNAKPNAKLYLPYFIRISPYPDPDPDQIRGSVDLGPPAAGSGNIALNSFYHRYMMTYVQQKNRCVWRSFHRILESK